MYIIIQIKDAFLMQPMQENQQLLIFKITSLNHIMLLLAKKKKIQKVGSTHLQQQ